MKSVKHYFSLFLLLFFSLQLFAQKADKYKQYRVLILLDGSSSMVENWQPGESRFKAAGKLISKLIDSVYRFDKNVEFGLRVYGHQHTVGEKNCGDTKTEVMFSKDNLTQMELRLEDLKPLGVSPIAFSLQTAAETDFADNNNYAYSLILVTDGGESCGGDICAVVQELLERKIQFRPYVVSLVDYAPLREQYSCLGTYLLSTNPQQMQQVVGTIAENYRKILKIEVPKTKPVPVAKTPLPSALKIDVPAITFKKQEVVKSVEADKTIVVTPKPQMPEPVKEIRTPIVHPTAAPEPSKQEPQPASKMVVNDNPMPKEKINSVASLKSMKQFPSFFATPTPPKKRYEVSTLPINEPQPITPTIQKPIPPVVATTKPKLPPTNSNKKEATFTSERVQAPITSLSVYFTNGKGKFFTTSPPMTLIDAATGKEVKRIYRTVDANGVPDAKEVPPGKYLLAIGRDGNYVAKNVIVLEGNNNKITIVVTKGTLTYAYENDLRRPVSEFTAVVRKNFDPGSSPITQPCTQPMDFEPGNYHIEVNTLPITSYNIDLDFGASYRVDVDEPGFVIFSNDKAMGKVSLYYQLGDRFVRFYVIDITGNVATQKVRLQPGPYEVHYSSNGVSERIKPFQIKRNQTISVQL